MNPYVMHRHLGENVDRLSKKINDMETSYKEKSQSMANIAESLDRLEKVLTDLNQQRDHEHKLMSRFHTLSNRLETATAADAALTPESFDIKLRRVLTAIKIVGQIIEVIASGTHSLYDSVYTISRNKSISEANGAQMEKPDLGAILKPMNSLIQALTSNSNQAQTPEPALETETPDDEQE